MEFNLQKLDSIENMHFMIFNVIKTLSVFHLERMNWTIWLSEMKKKMNFYYKKLKILILKLEKKTYFHTSIKSIIITSKLSIYLSLIINSILFFCWRNSLINNFYSRVITSQVTLFKILSRLIPLTCRTLKVNLITFIKEFGTINLKYVYIT